MPHEDIQRVWRQRQQDLGNTKRAVLFKNLPTALNNYIHHQHVSFILREMEPDTGDILDVGCGYGRIAKDILARRPRARIEGVEIVPRFADHFSSTIGRCHTASIQTVDLTGRRYDAVLLVTVLMYLARNELDAALAKVWECLRPGGCLICIEPYYNFLVSIRQKMRIRHLEPTAGEMVSYFGRGELSQLLRRLPGAAMANEERISMLPLVHFPVLHRAVAARKAAS